MAGLRCAQVLEAAGAEVLLLEASDRVGGRVATDVVDGYRIDRGFQLLNPSYPQALRALDLDALDLRSFAPGLVLSDGESARTITDPLRRPLSVVSTLAGVPGTLRDRLNLGVLLARLRAGQVRRVIANDDAPARSWLARRHIGGDVTEQLLRPFLSGVLLDGDLESSGHLVALLLRSFVAGIPALPSDGMGAIPSQMVAGLTSTTIELSTPVAEVTSDHVVTEAGTRIDGDAVVLAAASGPAAHLLPGGERQWRSVTTWWFASDEPSTAGPSLVVDQTGGTLVNSVEMTSAAPSYAPAGRRLIASSGLGVHGGPDAERAARDRTAALHGIAPSALELVATTAIPEALPTSLSPLVLRPPIEIEGIVLAGDHVATPSIQGAMASGERAARMVLARSTP